MNWKRLSLSCAIFALLIAANIWLWVVFRHWISLGCSLFIAWQWGKAIATEIHIAEMRKRTDELLEKLSQ